MISQIANEIVTTIGMTMTAAVEPTTSALPSSELTSDQNREEIGRGGRHDSSIGPDGPQDTVQLAVMRRPRRLTAPAGQGNVDSATVVYDVPRWFSDDHPVRALRDLQRGEAGC